jgi:hypothetical protein
MRDKLDMILVVIAVLVILSLGIWWTVYKYGDCKKVGHGTTYCVVKIFTH